MARRTERSDMPSDPAAIVRALRSCRDVMITVHRTVKPSGPVYHGASMVLASIDAFTTLITGHRYYFGIEGSTACDAGLEDLRAREAGEKPWSAGD